MIQPIATGTATIPPGATASMQDAQAALRARLTSGGNTPSAAPATLIGRPVLGGTAPEQTRADMARKMPQAGEWQGQRDPLLTGPRPTFAKTPLEKMRSDMWEVPTTEPDAPPPPEARPDGKPPPDEKPHWPEIQAQSAYDGIRAFDGPPDQATGVDRVS